MKIKQKLKPFIYTAAVLCMSISCKKDECPCGECGAPKQKMSYVTTLENARADVDWNGDFGIENIGSGISVCFQQLEQYEGKFQQTLFRNKPIPYKYRVWGKIYNCDNCPTLIPGPSHELFIHKIEYQN